MVLYFLFPRVAVFFCTLWIRRPDSAKIAILQKIAKNRPIFFISSSICFCLQLPESWISKNRIILKAREMLKRLGLLHAEKLDCLKTVLDRLPTMIREQRAYEKVHNVAIQSLLKPRRVFLHQFTFLCVTDCVFC